MDWPTRRRKILAAIAPQKNRYVGIATCFVTSLDDAEEAWQRALVKALEKMPPMGKQEAERWLYTVVRNEARRVRAGLKIERESVLVADHDSVESFLNDPEQRQVDPKEALCLAETLRESASAFNALSEPQRIALSDLSRGLRYKEIAKARGWSYTKVNRLLAEGREAFRRQKTPSI